MRDRGSSGTISPKKAGKSAFRAVQSVSKCSLDPTGRLSASGLGLRPQLPPKTAFVRDGVPTAVQCTKKALLLSGHNCAKEATHAIKRGLLWQQRDKLFSRWKERYFILTRDYLHCFRRASGADRISEMGQFLFKVKLVDVERVEWENKKTYSAVALMIGRDGKIYLRAPDGLEEWFELLEECTVTSKERRRALRHSHDGKQMNNNHSNAYLDDWLAARQTHPVGPLLTKPEVTLRRKDRKEDEWDPDNRLSRILKAASKKTPKRYLTNKMPLLTDIGAYDASTLGGASTVTSYRIQRDVTRGPCDSFRSSRGRASRAGAIQANVQYVKFRERSYSDIPRIEPR